MIAASWSTLSLAAPRRFQEDITPLADTLTYDLLSADFDAPNPDVELQRVEVWDITTTPHRAWRQVEPQSAHPMGLSYSQAGWVLWDGVLELPNRIVDMIDPTRHMLRVWGYSPWPLPVDDIDAIPFTPLLEECSILLCRIEALRNLTQNRAPVQAVADALNNTDISVPMLLNDLNMANDEWRRKERRITILREAP